MALYSACVCRGYGGKVNTKMAGNGFLLTLLSWASNDLEVPHAKVSDKVFVGRYLLDPFSRLFSPHDCSLKNCKPKMYLVFY